MSDIVERLLEQNATRGDLRANSIEAAARITALEAQIAAADRLADAIGENPNGIKFGGYMAKVYASRDAYRAAKEAAT